MVELWKFTEIISSTLAIAIECEISITQTINDFNLENDRLFCALILSIEQILISTKTTNKTTVK